MHITALSPGFNQIHQARFHPGGADRGYWERQLVLRLVHLSRSIACVSPISSRTAGRGRQAAAWSSPRERGVASLGRDREATGAKEKVDRGSSCSTKSRESGSQESGVKIQAAACDAPVACAMQFCCFTDSRLLPPDSSMITIALNGLELRGAWHHPPTRSDRFRCSQDR